MLKFQNLTRLYIRRVMKLFVDLYLIYCSEEDVTSTMYTAFYDQQPANCKTTGSSSKVDIVCDAMIDALTSINFDQ